MVCLAHDQVEELARVYAAVCDDRNASCFCFFKSAGEFSVSGMVYVRKAQFPGCIVLDSAHESVGDADRNIKVSDRVLVCLALDKFFDIWMIHTKDSHVSAAASTALGDLTKGVIIHTQESDWAGGFTGRCFHDRTAGAQGGKRESVPAAGLLD